MESKFSLNLSFEEIRSLQFSLMLAMELHEEAKSSSLSEYSKKKHKENHDSKLILFEKLQGIIHGK